jgi:hypothetical protein
MAAFIWPLIRFCLLRLRSVEGESSYPALLFDLNPAFGLFAKSLDPGIDTLLAMGPLHPGIRSPSDARAIAHCFAGTAYGLYFKPPFPELDAY